MPVNLELMREALMPGLMAISGRYSTMPAQWEAMFAADAVEEASAAPLLTVPVSLPAAIAIGAAAVVIKNPTVTRRFWSWFNAVLE